MKKWMWVVIAAVAALLAAGIAIWFFTDWTVTVGICYRYADSDSNREYRDQLEKSLQDMGYEVVAVDCDNDQSKQLQQLRQLKEKTAQVLIVEPAMSAASEELLAALEDLALPAVLVGEIPEETPEQPGIVCVGTDSAVPGILHAQTLLELSDQGDLNGDGAVSCMILTGPEDSLESVNYYQCCLKALKLGPLGTDLLCTVSSDGTREGAHQRTAAELRTYGMDIEVILCANDTLALGAADAIREGGWKPGQDIYLFGVGGTAEAVKATEEGTLTCTVLELPGQRVQTVTQTVQAMLEETPVENCYILECVAVTAKNAAEYLPK